MSSASSFRLHCWLHCKVVYVQCFGSSKLHRVCKYYNLLLWNGTLYYPTTGIVLMPSNSTLKLNHRCQAKRYHTAQDIISKCAVTFALYMQCIAVGKSCVKHAAVSLRCLIVTDEATLVEGPPRVPISWVQLSPFDKLEFGQHEWAEAVLPSDLPFDWATTPKLSMKEALFWKLTFQDNYGHLLGEHGPIIHNLMCTYLNRSAFVGDACLTANVDKYFTDLVPLHAPVVGVATQRRT